MIQIQIITTPEEVQYFIDNAIQKAYDCNPWRKYPEERPTNYGKYEVYRAGCKKQHYQTWNNTGFAYDDNDITNWRDIIPPIAQ